MTKQRYKKKNGAEQICRTAVKFARTNDQFYSEATKQYHLRAIPFVATRARLNKPTNKPRWQNARGIHFTLLFQLSSIHALLLESISKYTKRSARASPMHKVKRITVHMQIADEFAQCVSYITVLTQPIFRCHIYLFSSHARRDPEQNLPQAQMNNAVEHTLPQKVKSSTRVL